MEPLVITANVRNYAYTVYMVMLATTLVVYTLGMNIQEGYGKLSIAIEVIVLFRFRVDGLTLDADVHSK